MFFVNEIPSIFFTKYIHLFHRVLWDFYSLFTVNVNLFIELTDNIII